MKGSAGDVTEAKGLADETAQGILGDARMCMSWYDRERDQESPKGINRCQCGQDVGYAEYAKNRGANLKIVVDGGRFTFFYCDAAETG